MMVEIATINKHKLGRRGRVSGVSAWFINKKISHLIKFKHINNRISQCIITLSNLKYNITGVYMPSTQTKTSCYSETIETLGCLIRESNQYNKHIVIGDFNADINRNLHNDNILKKWIEDYDCLALDLIETQRVPNTFLNGKRQSSHIDHIFLVKPSIWHENSRANIVTSQAENELMTSNLDSQTMTKHCWCIRNYSDHRPIEVCIPLENVAYPKFDARKSTINVDWSNVKHKMLYVQQLSEEISVRKIEKILYNSLTVAEAKAATWTKSTSNAPAVQDWATGVSVTVLRAFSEAWRERK